MGWRRGSGRARCGALFVILASRRMQEDQDFKDSLLTESPVSENNKPKPNRKEIRVGELR